MSILAESSVFLPLPLWNQTNNNNTNEQGDGGGGVIRGGGHVCIITTDWNI